MTPFTLKECLGCVVEQVGVDNVLPLIYALAEQRQQEVLLLLLRELERHSKMKVWPTRWEVSV